MKAAKRVVEETYADYEKLVYHTVGRFVRKYGGDYDEYVSEANVIFLNCFDKFDRTRGYKFSTYLVTAIFNRLRNVRKNDVRHADRYNTTLDAVGDDGKRRSAAVIDTNDEGGFDLSDLSESAKSVLELFINTPENVRELVAGSELSIGEAAKEWRKAIRGFFKRNRVNARWLDDAMDELAEAFAA